MKRHNFYFELYTECEDRHQGIAYLHISTEQEIWKEICDQFLCTDEHFEKFSKSPYDAIYNTDIKHYLRVVSPEVLNHFNPVIEGFDINDDKYKVRMCTEREYRAHDEKFNQEMTFLEGFKSDKEAMDKLIEISEDILKEAGFEENTNEIEKTFWESQGIKDYSSWRRDTHDVDGDQYIIIDFRKGVTNNCASWGMHLDNNICESIGSADISNVWQFNTIMNVFGSKFRI